MSIPYDMLYRIFESQDTWMDWMAPISSLLARLSVTFETARKISSFQHLLFPSLSHGTVIAFNEHYIDNLILEIEKYDKFNNYRFLDNIKIK